MLTQWIIRRIPDYENVKDERVRSAYGKAAGLSASLKPSRLIKLLDTSDRLFTASAMIATEPLSSPANNLPANSSTLQPMPTRLAALP